MRISIITVVYNNLQVTEALDSTLSQQLETGDELEVVVIDGGSTDGTRAVLEDYRDRLAVLVSERDRGIYDAMNKGLSLATGDVIGTLNADDLYADTGILRDVARAFRLSEAEAVYGDLVYVQRECPDQVIRYWRSSPFRPGAFKSGWMPPHPTFFVRRQVYDRCGKFDLSFRIAADVELLIRLIEVHRIPTVHIPRILVRMRMGGASNRDLSSRLRATRECFRALRMHGQGTPLLYLPRKIVHRSMQFLWRQPGGGRKR